MSILAPNPSKTMLTPVPFNSTPMTANTSIELELVDDESYSSMDHQVTPESLLGNDTQTRDSSNGETEKGDENQSESHQIDIEEEMQMNIKESIVLKPGDVTMTREQIPPKANWFYIICYINIIFTTPCMILFTWFDMKVFNHNSQWFYTQISLGLGNAAFVLLFNWFNGAILRDYIGIKANYSRKITHFTFFTLPYIVAALVGNLDPVVSNMFTWFSFQLWVICVIIPTRKFVGKYIDYKQSKYKYLNFGEYMLNAIERSEDRPNTLLWIQLQVLLMGIVLYPLGFWWSYLDKPYLILIPQIVNGIGDGLAEPIGVKFGKNHQYKTKAWCSKNLYVRSYQGSAMVLFSGFLAVIYVMIAYNEYTLGQFIIALVFVPIIGTIVEAKAPHTLDNPFITLFVGIAATLPLYIDI